MGDSNTRRNLPKLFEFVRDDFMNGLHILDFCATLENCLKYPNTWAKLRNFRKTADPLRSTKLMSEKLQIKKEIDTKLKSIHTCAKVSSTILVTTFEAILLYLVMTAMVFVPPVTTALVAAVAFPWFWWASGLTPFGRIMKIRLWNMEGCSPYCIILIDCLEVHNKSLLLTTDFVIEEGAEAEKLGMADIKKKLRDFLKDVK
ncbi:UPF0496 protein At4g34320-like [Eucalyptus grandis]|uniref:UPF0496 protein At4g34320-like n=1 Tax=Eucalyptus grandis TaxID=71139 RepID=UPI00192E8686|nr:UPF0496 protein At4g34320-like [Eucalyptus grandis]